MASVRKRTWTSKGQQREAWIVDYFAPDRVGELRRHIKTFERKKEADAWRSHVEGEIRTGDHISETDAVTVKEAAKIWLTTVETLRKRERSTVRQYQNHVDHHIVPLIGHLKLSALTAAHCEKFRDDLLSRPFAEGHMRGGDGGEGPKLSHPMAKKVLGSLKGILKEARRRRLCSRNPAEDVAVEMARRGARKVRAGHDFPTKEEARTLLKIASGRWRPMFFLFVFAGLRSSELRGLTWDDVDFKAGVIHLRQRADAWGRLGALKSEAGEREIPIPDEVVLALKEWKLAAPKSEGRLVFATRETKDKSGAVVKAGGKPESHANIANRGFYRLQLAAGMANKVGADTEGKPILKPKYGLHDLRHFYASWIIERGFSPKRAQTLLGHSSIQMTFDTYGHLFPTPEEDRQRVNSGAIALLA